MRSDVARTFAAKVYSRTVGIAARGVRPLGLTHLEPCALRGPGVERSLDRLAIRLPVLRPTGFVRVAIRAIPGRRVSSRRRERGRLRADLGPFRALPAHRLHDRRRPMPPAVLSLLDRKS